MYQLPVPSPNVQPFLPLASILCLLVSITEPRCLRAVLEQKGTRRGHGDCSCWDYSYDLNCSKWRDMSSNTNLVNRREDILLQFIVECLFHHGTLNPRVKWKSLPTFIQPERVFLPLNVHMDLTSITMWLASGFRCKDVNPMCSERRGMSTLAMPIWSTLEQRRHPLPHTYTLWRRKMEEGWAEKEEVQESKSGDDLQWSAMSKVVKPASTWLSIAPTAWFRSILPHPPLVCHIPLITRQISSLSSPLCTTARSARSSTTALTSTVVTELANLLLNPWLVRHTLVTPQVEEEAPNITASRERKGEEVFTLGEGTECDCQWIDLASDFTCFVAHCCPGVYISEMQMRSKPHSVFGAYLRRPNGAGTEERMTP